MKARIESTGEIIEISEDCSCVYAEHFDKSYNINELEFLDVKENSFPKDEDYWTRLEHQYAGMFVKSFLDQYDGSVGTEDIINSAIKVAHALVDKMKNQSV